MKIEKINYICSCALLFDNVYERPREKLNFSTPKCEFFKHLL